MFYILLMTLKSRFLLCYCAQHTISIMLNQDTNELCCVIGCKSPYLVNVCWLNQHSELRRTCCIRTASIPVWLSSVILWNTLFWLICSGDSGSVSDDPPAVSGCGLESVQELTCCVFQTLDNQTTQFTCFTSRMQHVTQTTGLTSDAARRVVPLCFVSDLCRGRTDLFLQP